MYKILDKLKSLFLNGILIILPVSITLMLFNGFFRILKGWLSPLIYILPACLKNIPQAEFILAITAIFIVGFISKTFVIKGLIHQFEKLLFKLPLIRPIYSGVKQLVHALTDQDKLSFNTVVMAEFPNKDSYCLAFLTGECPTNLNPDREKTYYNIYIPTTPNPTTGFFILMPKEKVIFTDLTRQEAMTIIISGGIIKPERFMN
jgi:uncharacterized membrane protein